MPEFPLGLTMGMMLSAPMILVGGWMLWRSLRAPAALTRRYRLLTEALVRAGAVPAVRSRIVPAAAALPRVFAGAVNLLAN